MRRLSFFQQKLLILMSLLAWCPCARAGAALWPANTGQVIETFTIDESTSAFNASGHLGSVDSWAKSELTSFLEYGATDNVTLVADATLGRVETGSPSAAHIALEPTEFGARVGVWTSASQVLSVQATLRTPTAPAPSGALFADGDSFGADARLLYSYSFDLFGVNGFSEIQAGYRLNGDQWNGEGHADFTLGLRPAERVLILLQSFGTLSRALPYNPKLEVDDKAQLSLVYDMNSKWSAQMGGFITIAGLNARQERGGILAVWRRF